MDGKENTVELPKEFVEIEDVRGGVHLVNPEKITGAVFSECYMESVGGYEHTYYDNVWIVTYGTTKIVTKTTFKITNNPLQS